MRVIKDILLYLWQLPQNILGLILIAFYKPEEFHIMDNGNRIYYSSKMSGGISLGKYSIVHISHYKKTLHQSLSRNTVRHEAIGHAEQSLRLGWLYLIVIGLPSIIWAGLYGPVITPTTNGYYKFYTERRADRLAGIKR